MAVGVSPSRDIRCLLEIMASLRDPSAGCPWDLQQTHRSLAPYALEEAYEVVDAIEGGVDADLRNELGDLLLQVVFHAQLARERRAFDFGSVVEGIAAKMLRRHPHVFSNSSTSSSADVAASWEMIKAQERQNRNADVSRGLLAGVATALPGLTRAVKLQARASGVGFDWNDVRLVLAKIREEIDEIEAELEVDEPDRLEAEIGDLLFAVANLARHTGADPERAIRGTNVKFERRFAFIERALEQRGSSPAESTLADMDALWDEAKRAGL